MTHDTKSWDQLHQEGLGPTQEAFLEVVKQARETRKFCPDVIWGMIQTADYARAMLTLVMKYLKTPDDVEAGVRARTARAALFGVDGRIFHTLLGEQALRTNIGGHEVMKGQLQHVLDAFDLPGVKLGIIPSRARLHIYPSDSFAIFDGKRVEIEPYGAAETITDERRIRRYDSAFGLLEQSAVYGESAKDIVRAELAELETLT